MSKLDELKNIARYTYTKTRDETYDKLQERKRKKQEKKKSKEEKE